MAQLVERWQLTTTQNSEFVTGATSISAMGSSFWGTTIYILDPVGTNIYYYVVGHSTVDFDRPSQWQSHKQFRIHVRRPHPVDDRQ